ncbi:hypothetical protein HanIR_Chr15g0775021 [Helianthus annuus]|nr:hypothetical protein HanIR_Chr15g0775021 [Helianthus annuus]
MPLGFRITKEKNALAERLRNAKAERKRFDDELKCYATENVKFKKMRILHNFTRGDTSSL